MYKMDMSCTRTDRSEFDFNIFLSWNLMIHMFSSLYL